MEKIKYPIEKESPSPVSQSNQFSGHGEICPFLIFELTL